jgi:hypothetical protein
MAQPPEQWKPTAGWHAGRVLKTLGPLLFGAWFLLVLSGRANDLVFGPEDSRGPHRFFLIFGGLLVISVITFVVGAIASRRRVNEFQRLAAQRGWRYQGNDTARLAGRWDWAPFGVGTGRSATNVILGEHGGYPFAAFQYHWTTSSGDDRTRHHIGVIALRLPAALPAIQVAPEGVIAAVAPGLARADIDLESDAFNRRYRVSCEDRKYAVDVLTPRTVEALLSVRPFRWRIDGADLIALGSASDGPAQVLPRVEVLAGIAARIPSFVWKDRGRPA